MKNEITTTFGPGTGLMPKSLDEAMRFCEMLASSDVIPKQYKGKPGDILVAIEWGMEVGLKPMQALNGISVINGRPSIWGDSALALVRASGKMEYIDESFDGDTAICRVKRRGEPETVRTFSMEDAKKAGLLNKPGPWQQYPRRMLQMRARAWALRDTFPDVLSGIAIAEEAQDVVISEASPGATPIKGELANNVEGEIVKKDEPLHKVVGNMLLEHVGGDTKRAKEFVIQALDWPADTELKGKWMQKLSEEELQLIKSAIEKEQSQPKQMAMEV